MTRVTVDRQIHFANLHLIPFDEAMEDGLNIFDGEFGLLTVLNIRRTWPKESKYEVIGRALDGRQIGIVCRITRSGKVRVITVYEDKP